MATIASAATNDLAYRPFYVFKISGLPHAWYAQYNPYSSAHGGSAWTTPAGVTIHPGMDYPEGSLEQHLGDLMGGIATPETVSLRFNDFDVTDANGRYKFFSRLWATGRVYGASSVHKATLDADLSASETTSFNARNQIAANFPASGDVYIEGETIGYASRSVASGVTTFSTLTRNKYQCVKDFPASGNSYPPTPYYRIWKNSQNEILPHANHIVSTAPLKLLGRACALYVGHVLPSGKPEVEANSILRFVGRITRFEFDGGQWVVEARSIMDDLEHQVVAPGLARAFMQNQIVLNDTVWRSFLVGVQFADPVTGAERRVEKTVTIPADTYTSIQAVLLKVNEQLAALTSANSPLWITTYIAPIPSGEPRVVFGFSSQASGGLNTRMYVRHGHGASAAFVPDRVGSLLSVLGFPPEVSDFVADDPATFGLSASTNQSQVIVAQLPPPSVFIPTSTMSENEFDIIGDTRYRGQTGSRFFLDQGDGSGRAWVRFGNGDIVRLSNKSSDGLATKGRLPFTSQAVVESAQESLRRAGLLNDSPQTRTYYYVPFGQVGSVEQVVVAPDPLLYRSGLMMLGQLLCSNWDTTTDGEFDVYPEGVGLGFNALVDKASMRIGPELSVVRRAIVDSRTKWGDLFIPIAKEHGLFAVWDPENGRITIRRFREPSSATSVTFEFNETNRSKPTDKTDVKHDRANVQTGFTIEWGGGPSYSIIIDHPDDKHVTIKDPTISPENSGPGDIAKTLMGRKDFFQYPRYRMRRTVSRRGFALAPGTAHKIVDATIPNPFTGATSIATADNVYGFLTSVRSDLTSGLVNVELIVNGIMPSSQFRPWAPCARVDFDANSGGFTNGWDAAAKKIRTVRHYTANSDASTYDGIDFVVGDKIVVTTRDNDGAPSYAHQDTIAAINTSGQDVTLTTGFASLSTVSESVMYFQKYTSAAASQQTRVAWKGDASDGLIQDTAANIRWS